MNYLSDDFLLDNKTAKILFNNYAKKMPIFDFHCHLSEKELLKDEEFTDIYQIWLAGDHYKWRLMRNFGIDEEYITGNKANKEKFFCYVRALETAFGNPLYHWSQVELKEFFNCEYEINSDNAEKIWNFTNNFIKEKHLKPSTLIKNSNVKFIFTTNEIFDNLQTFVELNKKFKEFTVLPAFRADKIMNIEAEKYLEFLKKLEDLTFKIDNISVLEQAIEKRLQDFISIKAVASDIAIEKVYKIFSQKSAGEVLIKKLNGESITEEDAEIFKGYLVYFLMKLFAKNNIKTELHIGAMRNNNSKMLIKLGLDTGFDSISDENSIKNLSKLLNKLNNENSLPKTIIFNLNPKMNSEIMTLIGCFQDSSAKGKLQFGAAWWFLDNKTGMENHLKDLMATGHIATFIGMLTDSRSFLSYPRHMYFRRILCNYLGELIEKKEITSNVNLVGRVVEDISYNNSIKYFEV